MSDAPQCGQVEILRMPAEEELLFVRGEAPIHARRLDYRADRPWRDMAAPNPLYMLASTKR